MYSKYNYIHSMKENTNKQTNNKQTNKICLQIQTIKLFELKVN
jgi:hypothetical protein